MSPDGTIFGEGQVFRVVAEEGATLVVSLEKKKTMRIARDLLEVEQERKEETPKERIRTIKPMHYDHVVRMSDQDFTYREIARMYGVSVADVSRVIKEHG